MNIPKYVGSRIKYFRTKKNITQQELGEYLNTTSQTISRYESGILQTNHETLFKLAEYFNVSINEFFPPTDKSKMVTEEEKKEILKQILKEKGILNENEEMTKEDFDKLINIAKQMKDMMDNKKEH